MDRVRSHHCLAGHDFRQKWKPQSNPTDPLTSVTFSSRNRRLLICYGLTPFAPFVTPFVIGRSIARLDRESPAHNHKPDQRSGCAFSDCFRLIAREFIKSLYSHRRRLGTAYRSQRRSRPPADVLARIA